MKWAIRYIAMRYGRLHWLWTTFATPNLWEYAEWMRRHRAFYSMGERVGIVVGAKFDNPGLVRIGNNVIIAPCTVFNHDGSVDVLGHAGGAGQLDPGNVCVDIRDNVFIGEGSMIRYGVRIGPNAVIGMGSVVTRDVPPFSVVAGNPAHVIRTWDEHMALLKSKAGDQVWSELLATRDRGFDQRMEPELTRLRQSSFAAWDAADRTADEAPRESAEPDTKSSSAPPARRATQ